MTDWIALTGPATGGRGVAPVLPGQGLIDRGTLYFDLALDRKQTGEQTLIDYAEQRGWARGLSLHLDAERGVRLRQRQGGSHYALDLACRVPADRRRLRLAYAWAAPDRRCRLTLETAAGEALAMVALRLRPGCIRRCNGWALPAGRCRGAWARRLVRAVSC